jgi:hypothetical protein
MKIHFLVRFADGTAGRLHLEKPAGAHPESEMAIASAFLFADKGGSTASQLRRCTPEGRGFGDWITRKESAPAILSELDRRIK